MPGHSSIVLNADGTLPGAFGIELNTHGTLPGAAGIVLNAQGTLPGAAGIVLNAHGTVPGAFGSVQMPVAPMPEGLGCLVHSQGDAIQDAVILSEAKDPIRPAISVGSFGVRPQDDSGRKLIAPRRRCTSRQVPIAVDRPTAW
jgi:hypothetical protein